jgi:gamma-glutamyl hercynylcysteine S-oxide synthase
MATLRESQSVLKQSLQERLEEARARTNWLLAPVSDEDLSKQHNVLMSPLVWDLGHIGNFEELWSVQCLQGTRPTNPQYDDMYDAFEHPRRTRASLPLLDRAECIEYLAAVRASALAALRDADLDGEDPLVRAGFVFNMIVQHEYQHNETMLATLQLMGPPGYRPEIPPRRTGAPPTRDMVLVEEGSFVMGTDDRTVAYDNERAAHELFLPSFWIDTAPVSNAAYAAFIEDGGYRRPELYSPGGREWLESAGVEAPQFWERHGDGWHVNRFGHFSPVNPNEPVQHLCFYEAEAFARWCGKRLPTEAEWEKAASWDPERQEKRLYPWGNEPPTAEHANLDQLSFGPMEFGAYPLGVSWYGCHQMIGDVWEWVASDFRGYPGFQAWPYREYSEVFFGDDYRMLRGGSWATRPGVIRNTFRNWDYPIRRQIFSGFRCARDAA